MSSDIIYSQQGQVGIATLNRPSAFNALNLPMILSLQQQLSEWQSDENIAAVVIRSEHEKAFCAGGDVRWLYDTGRSGNSEEQMAFFWHEYRLNQFIHHFNKPYIALMNGITMGGGVGISLHGSYPVATENFQFAMPETSIGFFPDIGASYLLMRCPQAIGIYLGLTGARLNAADALYAGLVRYVIAAKDYDLVLADLAERDLSREPHKQTAQCLQSFHQQPSETPILRLLPAINTAFCAQTLEKIIERIDIKDWLNNLAGKSPLSLKVTLKQLHRAKEQSMDECIAMDQILVKNFMQGHDFYEGVRALLVDKDKNPQWQPATLAEVDENMITNYFT